MAEGEVLSHLEPPRRPGEVGTLAQYLQSGQRSSYLLVLLWVGFKKGWWKSIADLLFQQVGVDDDADPAMPSPGGLGRVASPAASISSSSSSCLEAFPVAPAVASAATSAPVAAATVASKPSASVEKPCHTVKQSTLRHNCKTTMQLAAVVLASKFSWQIVDALTIVCSPVNEAFNLMRTTFHSLKVSVDWRHDMSHGATEKEIIGTWVSVCSLADADGVGFIPGVEAPYVLPAAGAQEAQLAEVMFQLTCRLCFSSLAPATTYLHKLPFFVLSRGQPDTNPTGRCPAQHGAFCGFAGSVGGSWSRRHVGGRFVRDLMSPASPFVRQVLATLVGFQESEQRGAGYS